MCFILSVLKEDEKEKEKKGKEGRKEEKKEGGGEDISFSPTALRRKLVIVEKFLDAEAAVCDTHSI